jgi:hypothetical protein
MRAVPVPRSPEQEESMSAGVEPLIPLSRASRATGLSYKTLRKLVLEERLPSYRVSGIPKVRLSEVCASIEKRGTKEE